MVEVKILNSKMKFLIRGVLFPGDRVGKNWNKEILKNNPVILHKKVAYTGIFFVQYVEDKKNLKKFKKRG